MKTIRVAKLFMNVNKGLKSYANMKLTLDITSISLKD